MIFNLYLYPLCAARTFTPEGGSITVYLTYDTFKGQPQRDAEGTRSNARIQCWDCVFHSRVSF